MRKAEPLAGLGGLLLLVSLFLAWYTGETHEQEGMVIEVAIHGRPTAWNMFAVIDILLALLALLAIAVPVASIATKGPAKAIGTAVLASTLGWLAVLLVGYRLVNPPGPNELIAASTGAWLALAGAVIAWVGSWLSLRDESTPGATVPDMPRLPAPPADAQS